MHTSSIDSSDDHQGSLIKSGSINVQVSHRFDSPRYTSITKEENKKIVPSILTAAEIKSKYVSIPLPKQQQISTNPNSPSHGGLKKLSPRAFEQLQQIYFNYTKNKSQLLDPKKGANQ